MEMQCSSFKTLKKVFGFSTGTFLSRITGLGREMVFAYLFGAGMEMDAFRVAFNIPNLFRDFFAEGGLNAAFVPVFTEYMEKDKKEGWKYFNSFFLFLFLFLSFFVALCIIFSPVLVNLVAGGFHTIPGKFELTVSLTRLCFPFLLLISLAAMFMGALTCFGRFFITGFAPVFLNLSIIGISLLFSQRLGIKAVALGVLAGGFLQAAFQYPFLFFHGYRPSLSLHPGVIRTLKLMGPVFIGFAATRINVAVNTFIASFLIPGAVSYLAYAYRLMQLPYGMFGVAVSTVALPELSRKVSRGEDEHEAFLRAVRISLLLTLPVALLLYKVSLPLVRLLYERGNFMAVDSLETSRTLVLYLIAIPFLSLSKVLQSMYYAKKDVKTPMRISWITMGLNITIALLLIPYLDYRALALSTSLSAMFQFLLLSIPYRKKLVEVSDYFLKLLLASSIPLFIPLPSIPLLYLFIYPLIFLPLAFILKLVR